MADSFYGPTWNFSSPAYSSGTSSYGVSQLAWMQSQLNQNLPTVFTTHVPRFLSLANENPGGGALADINTLLSGYSCNLKLGLSGHLHMWLNNTNQLYMGGVGDITVPGIRYDDGSFSMWELTAYPSSAAAAQITWLDAGKAQPGLQTHLGNWNYNGGVACTSGCGVVQLPPIAAPTTPQWPAQPAGGMLNTSASASSVAAMTWLDTQAIYGVVTPYSPVTCLPIPAFLGGNGGALDMCCNFIQGAVGNTVGKVPNALCDPEVAGFLFGALGPGNAPAGQTPVGPFTFTSMLSACNALGYTDIYWPQNYLVGATPQPAQVCSNSTGSALPATYPNPVPGSTRAPYLVAPTSTSITIRWRSATPTPTVVSYGTSMGALSQTFSADVAGVIDHSAKLTGLAPGTTYSSAAGGAPAAAGAAPFSYFKTAPATGSPTAFRAWLMGDFGEISAGVPMAGTLDSGREVNVYTNWLAFENATGHNADLFYALGDNAYNTGSDAMYQASLGGFETRALTLPRLAGWF